MEANGGRSILLLLCQLVLVVFLSVARNVKGGQMNENIDNAKLSGKGEKLSVLSH